jgi:acetyl-CoA carboxylase biotin carboxylase subunit
MALDETVLDGIKTNIPLHKWLLLDQGFVKGSFNIHYLEKRLKDRASHRAPK